MILGTGSGFSQSERSLGLTGTKVAPVLGPAIWAHARNPGCPDQAPVAERDDMMQGSAVAVTCPRVRSMGRKKGDRVIVGGLRRFVRRQVRLRRSRVQCCRPLARC